MKIGVEAGVNLNNLADRYENETTSNQIKMGFHGGVVADIGLGNTFSVQPGLRYSLKGGQQERNQAVILNDKPGNIMYKNKLSYHYVELPVNLVYKTGVEGSGRFLIGAGPYVAYMVNATNKQKIKTTGFDHNGNAFDEDKSKSYSFNIGDDPDEQDVIKGLDYGAQAFVGYELPMGLFAKVGSQVGFANTQRTTVVQDLKQKNYNFFLTLGYWLTGKGE
jgi:hypothetical protein